MEGFKALGNVMCTFLALLVLLAAPTGWLYYLQAVVHTHHSGGVKKSVNVSEYIYTDYPFPPFQRLLQGFVGGYYNRYYLTRLEDGSWL